MTYLVALCACGCVHMAIPTSHPDCAAWRASWGQRGYVCAEMTAGQLTREGRTCVVHGDAPSEAMQVAANMDRVKIYGEGR